MDSDDHGLITYGAADSCVGDIIAKGIKEQDRVRFIKKRKKKKNKEKQNDQTNAPY